eukprot:TRINITY_DN1214_c0_g1_i1.p1 TRINITY_DN1214_c0_g1~~TRINITY_DN1214_c0_g1_i1.p1  ORF type:complete len:799 (+),score=293.13 TRINITY_DN1214_c0_g1_i1:39-2435(+)
MASPSNGMGDPPAPNYSTVADDPEGGQRAQEDEGHEQLWEMPAEETRLNFTRVHKLVKRNINKGFVVRELGGYILFLFFLLMVLFLGRSEIHPPQVHSAVDGIKKFIVDNNYDMTPDLQFEKTFWDVVTENDFWRWVEGPFLTNIWNKEGLPPERTRYLGDAVRPIGYVILRQQRVRPTPCSKDTVFHAVAPGVRPYLAESCFPEYHCTVFSCELDDRNYGPDGRFHSIRNRTAEMGGGLEFPSIEGDFHTYASSSYNFVEKLPVESTNLTHARDLVARLKENNWVDPATRFIAVETMLLNRNMGLFVPFTAYVEITHGGNWVPGVKLTPFNFTEPGSVAGVFIFIFDVIISLYISYVFYRLVSGLRRHYLTHHEIITFFSFFNTYTMADTILFIVTYGYRWHLWHVTFYYDFYKSTSDWNENEAESLNKMYTELSFAGTLFETHWKCYGWATAIAIGGLSRFTQYNPRLYLLVETIERALGELISVIVMLAVVLLAYSILGNVLLGYSNDGFQTVSRSAATLLLHLLGYGEWDLNGLDRFTKALYFLTYYFFAWAILLNMILAVINESLSAVKQRSKTGNTHILKSLQKLSKAFFTRLNRTPEEKEELAAEAERRKEKDQAESAVLKEVYEKLKLLKAERPEVDEDDDVIMRGELQSSTQWTDEEWNLLNHYIAANKDDVYVRDDDEKETLDKMAAQLNSITNMMCKQALGSGSPVGGFARGRRRTTLKNVADIAFARRHEESIGGKSPPVSPKSPSPAASGPRDRTRSPIAEAPVEVDLPHQVPAPAGTPPQPRNS